LVRNGGTSFRQRRETSVPGWAKKTGWRGQKKKLNGNRGGEKNSLPTQKRLMVVCPGRRKSEKVTKESGGGTKKRVTPLPAKKKWEDGKSLGSLGETRLRRCPPAPKKKKKKGRPPMEIKSHKPQKKRGKRGSKAIRESTKKSKKLKGAKKKRKVKRHCTHRRTLSVSRKNKHEEDV